MKTLTSAAIALLFAFSPVAFAAPVIFTGTWEVADDPPEGFEPFVFAGGPVSIMVQDIDDTNRVLTAELSSDFDDGTGVCGNDTTVTVVLSAVLSEGVWKLSITDEDPDAPGPDFPTFGVTGDIVTITDATPAALAANSAVNEDFINGPFCAEINGDGEITSAEVFTLGDKISLNFLADGFGVGTVDATLTQILEETSFEDGFEELAVPAQ